MDPIARLSRRDRVIVGECLAAAVHGSFFDESEFQTLIGLQRHEVEAVRAMWPAGGEHRDLAVANVLNNLVGYPWSSSLDEWSSFISVSRAEVAAVLARWHGRDSRDHSSYFDNMQ
jgi:hypothetical protein